MDGQGEFNTGRFHKRGVEGTTDFQWQSPSCAGSFDLLTGDIYSFMTAGDDQLPRAVEIRRNYHLINGSTDLKDLLVIKSDDRRHGRGLCFTCFLHSICPGSNQLQAIFK